VKRRKRRAPIPARRYCAVNPRIASAEGARYVGRVNAGRSNFWQRHPGLVWSNPQANDSVHIRAALLRPRFSQLLDIAVEFGLERVQEEWRILQSDPTPEFERARPVVERILRHISEGFSHAAAGN